MFSCDTDKFHTESTLTSYISYVSKMILAGLVEEQHHALYEQCVLDFLEQVSHVLLKNKKWNQMETAALLWLKKKYFTVGKGKLKALFNLKKLSYDL